MKRGLAGLVAALLLTACTPAQVARWFEAKNSGDPIRVEQADLALAGYSALRDVVVYTSPCPDAYDYAMEAGLPSSMWPTMAYIARRESNCNNRAVSRSHDYCWWQINAAAHFVRLRAEGIIQSSMTELLDDPQKCADAMVELWHRAGLNPWSATRPR